MSKSGRIRQGSRRRILRRKARGARFQLAKRGVHRTAAHKTDYLLASKGSAERTFSVIGRWWQSTGRLFSESAEVLSAKIRPKTSLIEGAFPSQMSVTTDEVKVIRLLKEERRKTLSHNKPLKLPRRTRRLLKWFKNIDRGRRWKRFSRRLGRALTRYRNRPKVLIAVAKGLAERLKQSVQTSGSEIKKMAAQNGIREIAKRIKTAEEMNKLIDVLKDTTTPAAGMKLIQEIEKMRDTIEARLVRSKKGIDTIWQLLKSPRALIGMFVGGLTLPLGHPVNAALVIHAASIGEAWPTYLIPVTYTFSWLVLFLGIYIGKRPLVEYMLSRFPRLTKSLLKGRFAHWMLKRLKLSDLMEVSPNIPGRPIALDSDDILGDRSKYLIVGTWNINTWGRNLKKRLETIGKTAEQIDYDVIFFQEVVLNSSLEILQREMPGYRFYYVPFKQVPGRVPIIGNRFALKGDVVIAVKEKFCLDGESAQFDEFTSPVSGIVQRFTAKRAAGLLTVKTKLGTLVTTHLAAVLSMFRDRSAPNETMKGQARELREFLKGIDGPKIVGGDFNTPPNGAISARGRRDKNRNIVEQLNGPGRSFSHELMGLNVPTATNGEDMAQYDGIVTEGYKMVAAGLPVPGPFGGMKIPFIDTSAINVNVEDLSDHQPVTVLTER